MDWSRGAVAARLAGAGGAGPGSPPRAQGGAGGSRSPRKKLYKPPPPPPGSRFGSKKLECALCSHKYAPANLSGGCTVKAVADLRAFWFLKPASPLIRRDLWPVSSHDNVWSMYTLDATADQSRLRRLHPCGLDVLSALVITRRKLCHLATAG